MLALYLETLDSPEDKRKFETLYQMYIPLMLYVAEALLHNREKAEDAVHDSFLKVLKILQKIETIDSGKTRGLLVIITKNTAKDMLKSKSTTTGVCLDDMEPILEDTSPLPLDQVISQEGYERLLKCINSLSETYKAVCQLRFLYEYEEKTIAELLNLTPKIVNMRIFRGRQKLKEMIRGGKKDEQATRR